MTGSARPEPFFIADDPALDFLNSVSAPSATQIDWLEDGYSFLIWLTQAEMLAPEVAERFSAEVSIQVLNEIARQARELRQWLHWFIETYAGKPLIPDSVKELELINRLLAGDEIYRQVVPQTPVDSNNGAEQYALTWQRQRRLSRPDDLMLPLAEAIGDLVCSADFSLVKNCQGTACTLWFFDTSKNHTRRWCTMSICGNRAKAAAHRARKRAEIPT